MTGPKFGADPPRRKHSGGRWSDQSRRLPGQLPLDFAAAEMSDVELASDLYDSTAILSLGGPESISATVAASLRERQLVALRKMLRRLGATS